VTGAGLRFWKTGVVRWRGDRQGRQGALAGLAASKNPAASVRARRALRASQQRIAAALERAGPGVETS